MFKKKPEKIFMKAKKQRDLNDIKRAIVNGIGAELVSSTERCIGDGQTILMVFERFYLRNGNYASLTILLSEHDDVQFADIIASGGGAGVFNISYGANANLAESPVQILNSYGFVKEW